MSRTVKGLNGHIFSQGTESALDEIRNGIHHRYACEIDLIARNYHVFRVLMDLYVCWVHFVY